GGGDLKRGMSEKLIGEDCCGWCPPLRATNLSVQLIRTMHNDWRDLIKPKGVDFDEKELTPNYGRFFAEPLERGYGITIGNALRRILLSSLPGFAITAVRMRSIDPATGKMKDVLHEFS